MNPLWNLCVPAYKINSYIICAPQAPVFDLNAGAFLTIQCNLLGQVNHHGTSGFSTHYVGLLCSCIVVSCFPTAARDSENRKLSPRVSKFLRKDCSASSLAPELFDNFAIYFYPLPTVSTLFQIKGNITLGGIWHFFSARYCLDNLNLAGTQVNIRKAKH